MANDQDKIAAAPQDLKNNSPGALIAALPEIYQPIFGHPEVGDDIKRGCEDRLAHIIGFYQALSAKLGRPLRVLDLGCAQGFFSFSLARLGAAVHGVDFLDANIALCKALAVENPSLNATFQAALVEDTIINLQQDQYDLVLGLSVFHHIAHRLGSENARKFLAVLAARTSVGIFEMALASEPLYWAPSLPQNPRQLLDGYAFVHEFAESPSHLSPTARPLYFASNYYWALNGRLEAFQAWRAVSHEFIQRAANSSRRYFFGNGYVVKQYRLDDADHREANLREHINETAFLSSPPPALQVPRLFLYGQHQREAWLVREYLPGEALLDKMRRKEKYDADIVIRDVLGQLAVLEEAGLYHNDLRSWNIMIGPDGHAALIDYGAVGRDDKDQSWPYNLFLSLMIFIYDVIHGNITVANHASSAALNPDNFPAPYNSALWKMLERAPHEWRFVHLRDDLAQATQQISAPPIRQSFSLIMRTIENACQIYQGAAAYWRKAARQSGGAIDPHNPE